MLWILVYIKQWLLIFLSDKCQSGYILWKVLINYPLDMHTEIFMRDMWSEIFFKMLKKVP